MNRRRPWSLVGAASLLAACATAPREPAWHELFDGRTLEGFAVTDFGGQGEVEVKHGRLCLGMGSPLTGVTWTGPVPAGDYELEITARRELGNDFFCGLTFPVGGEHLTLVLGGWGGTLCGLSSLDGNDAANNDTRTLRRFDADRDYTANVTVRAASVACTLDGQTLCAIDPRRHRLGLRPEVQLSRPLGVASFATATAITRLRWRELPAP